MDNAPEITVLQLPKFKAEATELIRADGIEALEQVWPKPIDIKAIRRRVKMSQAEFSRTYGISKRALQEWEQGGRQPDSASTNHDDRAIATLDRIGDLLDTLVMAPASADRTPAIEADLDPDDFDDAVPAASPSYAQRRGGHARIREAFWRG